MKLLELLNGVRYGRYDKTVHFLLSALITLTLTLLLPVWVAAAVALCVGVGKEWYDWRMRRSRFDLADLVVNVLGIGAALIAVRMMQFGVFSLNQAAFFYGGSTSVTEQ